MARRSGGALIWIGVGLLLLSLGVLGYSRFVEWRHAADSAAVAPPTEVLADRLPVPSYIATEPANVRRP
jgi:hypothetical protein